MTNLISKAFAVVASLLNKLQVKQLLAVVLVGSLLLTSGVDAKQTSKAVTKEIDKVIHEGGSDRPKTTGEWNREARQTEGNLGKRVQQIGKESAEAVKDLGKVYPDTAERSGVQDAAEDAGRAISNQLPD